MEFPLKKQTTSCWFQPIWKILDRQLGSWNPKVLGENSKFLWVATGPQVGVKPSFCRGEARGRGQLEKTPVFQPWKLPVLLNSTPNPFRGQQAWHRSTSDTWILGVIGICVSLRLCDPLGGKNLIIYLFVIYMSCICWWGLLAPRKKRS